VIVVERVCFLGEKACARLAVGLTLDLLAVGLTLDLLAVGVTLGLLAVGLTLGLLDSL